MFTDLKLAELAKLKSGEYEFIDFGCSQGKSLRFGIDRIGARRGVGIDIDPKKVTATQEQGFDAIQLDVTQLETLPDCVSFVLMLHFLEHLPGYRLARHCIKSGMMAARDFVMIMQPWFDSDGWLFEHGVKLFWSDWRGHDFTMSQLQLHRALQETHVPCRYRIYGRRPILDTSDPAVHPLSSPYDQHAYRLDLHGPKPNRPISVTTFYEIQCVILLSERFGFAELEQHLDGGGEHCLFEGRVR